MAAIDKASELIIFVPVVEFQGELNLTSLEVPTIVLCMFHTLQFNLVKFLQGLLQALRLCRGRLSKEE